jgi:hypothetical protein
VHLMTDEKDDEADFCWLLADIKPDVTGDWSERPPSLRYPASWRILRSDFDPRELRTGPIVVHLNGCPLLPLPDLKDRTSQWAAELCEDMAGLGLIEQDDDIYLIHAVTVDEYLALRQSEAELFWASEDRRDRVQRMGRALPPDLTCDTSRHARFWMVLGVPVEDSAIRHRVTSQFTARRFRDPRATNPAAVRPESGLSPRPRDVPAVPARGSEAEAVVRSGVLNDVDGVAVNKRVEDGEASILHWLGLDVVHAACAEFTPDLHHYAQHVARERLGERTPDTGCDLDTGEAAR